MLDLSDKDFKLDILYMFKELKKPSKELKETMKSISKNKTSKMKNHKKSEKKILQLKSRKTDIKFFLLKQ